MPAPHPTSAAIVATPEPPRSSACPDPGAAAPTLSPFAEAVLAVSFGVLLADASNWIRGRRRR